MTVAYLLVALYVVAFVAFLICLIVTLATDLFVDWLDERRQQRADREFCERAGVRLR